MPIKWNLAVLALMLGFTMLFAIMDKGSSAPGAYTGGAFVLDTLTSISIMDIVNPASWVVNFVTGRTFDWAQALVTAALFDYGIFTGAWVWARYFFLVIGLAWLVSLIIALGRGVAAR